MARRGAKGESGGRARPPPAKLRVHGLGIAAKFSIATSAVVAASMLVYAIVLNGLVSSVLSREIDEAGVLAVRALSVTDIESWRREYGTGLPPGSTQGTKTQVDQVTFNVRRAQQIAESGSRVHKKILDAVILDAERRAVINGAGTVGLRSVHATRKDGEIEIAEGLYDKQGQSHPARTYAAPLKDIQQKIAGWAVVALSEEAIEQTLGRVLRTLFVLTALFIALGLMVSWLVAQRITRPLQQLSGDMEIVARGDLEHRAKIAGSDEIGLLARTFDRMTQSLKDARELERRQAAQDHQIQIAREVQTALLPESLPQIDGFECAAGFQPAAGVSADYYDVLPGRDGAWNLIVVSASGSGVPAAMVTTMGRSLMKAAAESEDSPAQLLRHTNRLLAPDLRRGMYVSVIVVRVQPARGEVVVANAGAYPLVRIRAADGATEPIHSDGIALGFDKGPVFDRTIKDKSVSLEAGDRLVLCSPKIFKIENDAGAAIGEPALVRLFQREAGKHSDVFVSLVLGAVARHRGAAAQSADVAFLTVKRSR